MKIKTWYTRRIIVLQTKPIPFIFNSSLTSSSEFRKVHITVYCNHLPVCNQDNN